MKGIFILLWLCGILQISILCAAQANQQTKQEPRALQPYQTIEREIVGGETHVYQINLATAEFLRAVVDSSSIDMAVTLFGPSGEKLLMVDLLKYPGPEPVSFTVAKEGLYRLEVRAAGTATVTGRYALRTEVKASASATDKDRQAAEQLLLEANVLESEGSKESLQKSIDKRGETLALWRKLSDRYWEAYSLHYNGRASSTLNKSQEALAFYNQALAIRKEIGDRVGQAATFNNSGVVYAALGEKEKALDHYRQALTISKAIGDLIGQARTLDNLGNLFEGLGEKQKALEFYNQALPLRRAVGDKASEAITLNNLGNVYFVLGEKQKALEVYNEVLPLKRAVGDTNGEAATLINLGNIYAFFREYQQALGFFNSALSLWRAIRDGGREADTLNRIALANSLLGYQQKALDYYNLALPLERAMNNSRAEAETLFQIGNVYKDLAEKQKALDYYSQALQLRHAGGDNAGEASILEGIGSVYSDLGEKEKAIDYYSRAVQLAHAAQDASREAFALISLAQIYGYLRSKQKALDYYNRALGLRHATGDRSGEAAILSFIGGLYRNFGENQKALDYHNQALPLTRALEDQGAIAHTLLEIGSDYYSLGEKQKALEFYSQALLLYRAAGHRKFEAFALNTIGRVYSELGEKQKALETYNQALQLSQLIGDKSGEASALGWIGDVYLETGEKLKALDYYNRALLLELALSDRAGEAIRCDGLMILWSSLHNPSLAIFYGKQAINAYQQLRSKIQGLEKEVQQTYLHSFENWYRWLADLLIAQGRLPEAQQVLGLLKEQEYFEFVQRDTEATSLTEVRISFTPTEAEIEKQFSQIASHVAEIGAKHSQLLALSSRTAEQEKELSELETQLESANQVFQRFLEQLDLELKKSKPGNNDVTTLRESQALMDTLGELKAVALYTIVGQDKFRVILITPDVQKAYEYAITAADLNKKVYAFRQLLQNPNCDPLAQAQELYRILIGPELARDIAQTKTQTIMWSLDGTLRYLPVAALHDGQKYLVESYRNVVFTLASREHLKDPVHAKWQALGVGVSREREVVDAESKVSFRFPALPGVREELRGIVRQETTGTATMGVLEGKVMLDESFTAEALKSSLRLRGGDQPYKLVHIASHFNFQPGDETKSFLLLGDGTLTLARLKGMTNLFSKVELLTLSACNTATGGSDGEGKEVEGFAVLAQRQGAEAIIATLWPVSDPSTSRLMQQFYRLREAKAGTSKAEALRQAQLALLRGEIKDNQEGAKNARATLADSGVNNSAVRSFATDPQKPFAHPYYWAPFILIGNWK